ncbi:hypothetical protein [Maribacter sp. Asnod2-G09]|uniref:hypothetical protein n=1 Tax=Maribacter sp. Asnod2-G09 TaxID=3160577 RepID=UPI00386BE5E0
MKLALLLPNTESSAPYLSYYLDIIEKNNLEYELFTWDREPKTKVNSNSYKSKNKGTNPLTTTIEYYRFGRFLKEKIKKGKFDRLIVFTPQLGIFLGTFLTKEYSGKYILDIRDYSPVIDYFKKRFSMLIQHSKITSISSKGFLNWLPKNRSYIISHNISTLLIQEHLQGNFKKTLFFSNDKIRVDTIGAIRDFEANSSLLNSLMNKDNFEMSFIGRGPAIPLLESMAKKNKIKNVKFLGSYDKNQETKLLKLTDFINIILDDNMASSYITTNRLYLSALLKIPCITRNDTEQSKIITKYNLGLSINNFSEVSNEIVSYKENFNKEQFIDNCTVFLQDVKKDQDQFEMVVQTFITEI